jgi:hypothetical protein
MSEKIVTYQELDVDAIRKPKGRSMIEFKVALWTDKVNEDERPRECRSSGKVTRSANERHGISPRRAQLQYDRRDRPGY